MNLPFPVHRFLRGPVRGMNASSSVTVMRPHHISHAERITVGDRSAIHRNALITPICTYAGQTFTPQIKIGSDVYIGPNLFLACMSRVVIGDGSVLSEYVYINDSNHGVDPDAGLIMKQPLMHGGDVHIGKSCFLGLRCAIMPGVTLGDHCVVGINSVVTTSFPAFSMIWGSPARLIRTYRPELKAWV